MSVAMPCFNQAWFLMDALRSLEAQVFRDFELILVDDASTDATRFVLDQFKAETGIPTLVIKKNENEGAGMAINQAMEHASGDLWTWVSSDNEMSPDWLLRMVHFMRQDASVGAVYSAYNRVELDRATMRRGQAAYFFIPDGIAGFPETRLLKTGESFYGPAFLIRKTVWEAAGEHPPGAAHDCGHWLRVEEVCAERDLRVIALSDPLCDYMVHVERVSVTDPPVQYVPGHVAEARERRGLV